MAMSSRQILDMVKSRPSGVTAGRARFAARQAADVSSHARFAEDAANLAQPKTETVTHPEDLVRGQARSRKALTPADLVWLQRLPQNPAEVAFPDAVELAAMAQGITASQPIGSSDRRLIESVYAPVKSHHDRRVATVALANARRPLPEVPASALPALADAIRREVPELTDSEVMARAGDALRQALEQRNAAQRQAVAQAEMQVLDVAGGDLVRTSPEHIS